MGEGGQAFADAGADCGCFLIRGEKWGDPMWADTSDDTTIPSGRGRGRPLRGVAPTSLLGPFPPPPACLVRGDGRVSPIETASFLGCSMGEDPTPTIPWGSGLGRGFVLVLSGPLGCARSGVAYDGSDGALPEVVVDDEEDEEDEEEAGAESGEMRRPDMAEADVTAGLPGRGRGRGRAVTRFLCKGSEEEQAESEVAPDSSEWDWFLWVWMWLSLPVVRPPDVVEDVSDDSDVGGLLGELWGLFPGVPNRAASRRGGVPAWPG